MDRPDDVTRHYATDDIAGVVLAALRREHGADVAITPDTLAPIDHFHGRGLAATKEMVALLQPAPGEHILDIGSGIGGPARWIAAHFGCHVTGIDLTPAFYEAAIALTQATGQEASVTFQQASATALPFAEDSFDRTYSQNVVMNIADKTRFYAEAFRVLRPGGWSVFSNLVAGPRGDATYPTPWAASAATSFLSTPAETERDLRAAGFEILVFNEASPETLRAQAEARTRAANDGVPRLGVHVFLGERYKHYQANSGRSMAEGRLSMIESLVRKPG
jgi:sarcosine/dimethylglycine N-methyltransferase